MNSGKWYLGKIERIPETLEQLNALTLLHSPTCLNPHLASYKLKWQSLSLSFFLSFSLVWCWPQWHQLASRFWDLDVPSGPMAVPDSHARDSLNCPVGLYKVLSNLPMALVPPAPGSWPSSQIVFISNERPSALQQNAGFFLFSCRAVKSLSGCSLPAKITQKKVFSPKCGPANWEGGSQQIPLEAASWQHRRDGWPGCILPLKIPWDLKVASIYILWLR